jgi:DNA repair protein RadA/Sms
VKHRYGATGELGLFEMTAAGLQGVADAGSLFLCDRRPGTPGSVVFPAIEGHRPLLVEIQALVAPAPNAPSPRRSASGYDPGRLALLLAVLDRRAGLRLGDHEVYVSVVGGVKVDDPGADLAVCMALASAKTGRPVAADLVVVGEVGLGGEVRQVTHTPRRLAEAARLGFTAAVVPPKVPADQELRACHVTTLAEAVRAYVGGVAASEDDQGHSADHGSQLGDRAPHRY